MVALPGVAGMPSRLRTAGAWSRVAVSLAGLALAAVLAACNTSGPARAARARPRNGRRGLNDGAAATRPASGTGPTASRWRSPARGPYIEPVIGGSYGGYIGMAGNWAHWQGCGGELVWSATNASQAATNFSTYHKGVGTGVYWFMAGPGVDPNYDGTVSEARTWGQQQAARALADIAAR